MNPLERRIIELSYRHKLTHISSCLNCVNVIAEIYRTKREQDIFVLGAGHAALAWFVVLEAFGILSNASPARTAEDLVDRMGTHPTRDLSVGIAVSAGSLGQAETVAVGLAMADPTRTVFLVTSDGAAMEGAVYEALRIGGRYCPNLKVTILYNGHGAYGKIALHELPLLGEVVNVGNQLPAFLHGIKGHYLTLTEEQYQECMS